MKTEICPAQYHGLVIIATPVTITIIIVTTLTSTPYAITWVEVKNVGFAEKQKNIEQGSRGYSGPGGV